MSQIVYPHAVMRAADPQHPSTPMSQQERDRANDDLQARYSSDTIQMDNTDPRYAAHAMLQTAKAASDILSPLVAAELPETQAGRIAAGAVKLTSAAAREATSALGDTIASRLTSIGNLGERVANASEEDGKQLGRAIAHGVTDVAKDITRGVIGAGVLSAAESAGSYLYHKFTGQADKQP